MGIWGVFGGASEFGLGVDVTCSEGGRLARGGRNEAVMESYHQSSYLSTVARSLYREYRLTWRRERKRKRSEGGSEVGLGVEKTSSGIESNTT